MENNKKNIVQIVAATISIMVVIGVIVLLVTQVGKNNNSTDMKADNNIASETNKSADNEMCGERSEDKNTLDNNATDKNTTDKNAIGKNITDKNTPVKAENTTKVTGEADLEAASKNTTAATKTATEKSTEELTTRQATQLQTTRQVAANPSSKNNTNSNNSNNNSNKATTCNVNGNTNSNGNSNGNSQGIGQTATTEDSYVDEVIRIVNEERAKQGLQPLKKNNDLCKVAGIRATETTSLFSHTRPNGESCFTILKEYNIPYMTVGENIAAGQQTPAEVMNAWMNSQGHRENIMNSSFGQIGVGVVKGGSYGIYWVQMFTN